MYVLFTACPLTRFASFPYAATVFATSTLDDVFWDILHRRRTPDKGRGFQASEHWFFPAPFISSLKHVLVSTICKPRHPTGSEPFVSLFDFPDAGLSSPLTIRIN